VINALAHTVWKLHAYHSVIDRDCLHLESVVYHLLKRYRKEFERAKRSFFQRVTQKDESATAHFVAVVAGLNVLKGATEVTELVLSDGYYCLKAALRRGGGDTGDDRFLSLIDQRKQLYPGMKLHLVN